MKFESTTSVSLISLMLAVLIAWPAMGSDEGADEPSTAPRIYGQGVRETPRLSPQQEQLGFHLPTGFEIQLVAAEPQIAKPMNMAFDARGRLWVTSTVEYPYQAAADQPARDSIRILEDTDGDGAADKVTTFAEGLNIPIGILPVDDGAIGFSIPNIWHFRDTNGDDVCDEKRKLLGPFDSSRDTHGMLNSFRRGLDGWIYACHGFNNQSQVTASDGSSVHLISGNTFRFRTDGSRIEQFTFGQVNPFGMAHDEWGNWYTADCHSKPISFLLHGGCYPSFGRPHDGMGFVPDMMSHAHGSTAICGLVYVTEPSFPKAFTHRFYSGNVMTSRINSNRIERSGATVKAIEMPDLLTSDDPWFRPVDLRVGPDGALYIADFYNKIIGHYEVPLTHPERDRDSGRIWRIVYRGNRAAEPSPALAKQTLTELLSEEFFAQLGSDYPTVRSLALDRLSAVTLSDSQIEVLHTRFVNEDAPVQQRLACLWALHRAKKLSAEHVLLGLRSHLAQLQAATLRSVAETTQASDEILNAVRALIEKDEAQVALAAASALASLGDAGDVRRLLAARRLVPESDPVLRHALNLAARALLSREAYLDRVIESWQLKNGSRPAQVLKPDALGFGDALAIDVARILPAIASPRAAEGLLAFIDRNPQSSQELLNIASDFAIRNLPVDSIDTLLSLISKTNSNDYSRQAELLSRVAVALKARGLELPGSLRRFGNDLVAQCMEAIHRLFAATESPIEWYEKSGRRWLTQPRACEDKVADALLASSHTLGESYIGTWETVPFACPRSLSFWIAGHNGFPTGPDLEKNKAVLVDAVSGNQLQIALPPRSDVAKEIRWDLHSFEGQQVRLECIDADNRNAYAWLAIGRFSDARLNPSPVPEIVERLANLLRLEIVVEPNRILAGLVSNPKLGQRAKAQLISAIAQGSGHSTLAKLVDLAVKQLPSSIHENLLNFEDLQDNQMELATRLAKTLSIGQERAFVRSMLADSTGRELLNQLVEQGHIALEALRGRKDLLLGTQGDVTMQKLAGLIAKADSQPDATNDLVGRRIERLQLAGADVEQGRLIFEKQCSVCHQLAGLGQIVGPQLDGVGARGLARLAEDLLLPNRNVDVAFRASTVLLEDGTVVSGLARQQADGSLRLTANDGKSVEIPASKIVERRDLTRSLMPENFGETISDNELQALLGYLVAQAAQRPNASK